MRSKRSIYSHRLVAWPAESVDRGLSVCEQLFDADFKKLIEARCLTTRRHGIPGDPTFCSGTSRATWRLPQCHLYSVHLCSPLKKTVLLDDNAPLRRSSGACKMQGDQITGQSTPSVAASSHRLVLCGLLVPQPSTAFPILSPPSRPGNAIPSSTYSGVTYRYHRLGSPQLH